MVDRRVVVTGLGVVSPYGAGKKTFWEGVSARKTVLEKPLAPELSNILAGIFSDFSPAEFVRQRKSLKLMSRDIQLAIAASCLALSDSGFREGSVSQSERFGTLVGTGVINNEMDELAAGVLEGFDERGVFAMSRFGSVGIPSFFPLWFLKYLPNMPACHISMTHGLKGPSNTLTTGFAAGLQAVCEAAHLIQRGDADGMLAGGVDSKTNPVSWAQFSLMEPGMVLAEGAAFLVLEELSFAQARKAPILAEVLGWGLSADLSESIQDKREGKKRSMQSALCTAQMKNPQEITDYGGSFSGILAEEQAEEEAFGELFGSFSEPKRSTSLTPLMGCAGYASGALQALWAVMSLAHHPAEGVEARKFLVHASGWGGQNASVVFGAMR